MFQGRGLGGEAAGGSGWPGSSLTGKAAGGSIILATIAIYPLFGSVAQ